MFELGLKKSPANSGNTFRILSARNHPVQIGCFHYLIFSFVSSEGSLFAVLRTLIETGHGAREKISKERHNRFEGVFVAMFDATLSELRPGFGVVCFLSVQTKKTQSRPVVSAHLCRSLFLRLPRQKQAHCSIKCFPGERSSPWSRRACQ